MSTSEKLERLKDKLAQCEDEFDSIVQNIRVMDSDGVRDAAQEMLELADKMRELEEKIERIERSE